MGERSLQRDKPRAEDKLRQLCPPEPEEMKTDWRDRAAMHYQRTIQLRAASLARAHDERKSCKCDCAVD